MKTNQFDWWQVIRRAVRNARDEMRSAREHVARAHLPLAKIGRIQPSRRPQVESLEARTLLVSALLQVNVFETWNSSPRVIPSTDPAGITYHAPSGHLFISDSEINELAEFGGHNVFEVNRTGKNLFDASWPGSNSEPTGITWNEADGMFYVTNDDDRTITRYDATLSNTLGSVKTRPLGVADPEDITADPQGNLYVVSGHPPLVGVFDSQFNFLRLFSTAERMTDAEGIAYNKIDQHLYLVSAVDQKIFEYTHNGGFVADYSLAGLSPPAQTPQGLVFAPCSNDATVQCLFIADGGIDNVPDGRVYEVRVGQTTPPIAHDRSIAIPEDSTTSITLQASDADGDPLSFVVDTGPANGTVSGTAPKLKYTPHSNFNGTDSIVFHVFDGWINSPPATLSIDVQPVNDPPVAEDVSVTTKQDVGMAISLFGIDLDGDTISYEIVSGPTNGQLTGAAPDVHYAPNPQFHGVDGIVYQIRDALGSLATGNVTIQVRSPSDPVTESFQDGVRPLPGYSGTSDAKVRGDWPERIYGTSTLLEVDGKPDIATLLRWQITEIPAGSTIQSATMTIQVVNPSIDQYSLYRLARSWDESTTTFLAADSTTDWQYAGVLGAADRDAVPVASVSAPASGAVTIPFNAEGLAMIQDWVNHPAANFGLVMQNYDDLSTDALEFSSSEATDGALRPKLTVTFVTPALENRLTNPDNHYDVNADGTVSPGDALLVINRVNSDPRATLPAGEEAPPGPVYYPDVSGDGVIAPIDVLMILNFLNGAHRGVSAEGEAPASELTILGPLFLFSVIDVWDPDLSVRSRIQADPSDRVADCFAFLELDRQVFAVGAADRLTEAGNEREFLAESLDEDCLSELTPDEQLDTGDLHAVFATWPR